ncbi:MAG: beta-ketoacyl-ACP synthase III [Thermomicrobium sp.]|nr:beta-ketoacyl-ACP synthase III [Thermomicrobium sp.]
MAQRAAITGWGGYVPARVLTNADLERMVATSDEWIVTRTGIRERRIAGPEDTTLRMATEAARRALGTARLDPTALDLVVVATTTPDYLMPATASLLQAALGATRAGAFDLVAACSGFVYALSVGAQFIAAGSARAVLVVGVDALTRWLDFTDRSTCVLFGDGAGAVVLEATDADEGVLSTVLGSDGSGAMHLYLEGFPELLLANGAVPPKRPVMRMDGREVFRFSVRIVGEAAAEAIARAGLTLGEIDLLIPHQANLRIIDAAVKRLGLPWEKVWVNLDRYGNTSAASVPLGLAEAAEQGVLRPGMNVVLVAFGAGLAWAASVVRWGARGVRREG